MARTAPYFPKSIGPGDGTTKDFALGFPFLDPAHVRVYVNGALKVANTDYVILNHQPGTDKAIVRFAVAPTNGVAVSAARNTPIERYIGNPAVSQTDALQAQYRMQEVADKRVAYAGTYGETALLAGTALSFIANEDGYVEKLVTRVEKAVTTGGAITVEIDGVAVTGLTVTIADGAEAGTVQSDVPTTAQSTTTKYKKGQTITITPAAAFATAGDVTATLECQPADL